MACECADYTPIELDRASITRRITQSPAIRTRLTQVSEHSEFRLALFRCLECGQFWQSGHEWNFADREYLFQVPPIEVSDWLSEPYRQPAAMMIYDAAMRNFFSRNTFEETDKPCRVEDCAAKANKLSVYCRNHHIETLQKKNMLVKPPIGRLFPRTMSNPWVPLNKSLPLSCDHCGEIAISCFTWLCCVRSGFAARARN
jgi:hypothetical protein